MKIAIWNIFIIFTCLIRAKVLGLKCYTSQAKDNACADRMTNEKLADPNNINPGIREKFFTCLKDMDPESGDCKSEFSKCFRATLKFGDEEVIYLGCDNNSDEVCNKLKDRSWPVEKELDKDSSKCEGCSEDLCNKKEGITKKDDDKPSSGSGNLECYNAKSSEISDCKTFDCLKQLVEGPSKEAGCEECSHLILIYENDEKLNIPFCDKDGAGKCNSFKDNPSNMEHLGFNKSIKSSTCESCKKDLCMEADARSKQIRCEFSSAFMLISTAAVILYSYKPF